MNTKKLLCKYLDEKNKGYVNGEDIICAVILIGVIAGLIISFFATIGLAILNGVYTPVPTLTEFYTTTHIGLGCFVSFMSCIVLYTAYLSLKTLFQHKFLICKRDGDEDIKIEVE